MTKKLEEEFNLPSIEELMPDIEPEEESEPTVEETQNEIVKYKDDLSIAERADAALPMVTGMEELDREMDAYASKAMATFDDLVDLGRNVEDRHAAPIFDSASKMLAAALQAKQAKMDKKMKMIELQMRQQRIQQEEKKTDAYVKDKLGTDEDTEEATGRIIGDRSELLAEIMTKMKNDDKQYYGEDVMKSFTQYLAESDKTWKFCIKTVHQLTDEQCDRIENHLMKYDSKGLSGEKKTILQSAPRDFPQHRGYEVYMYEFETDRIVTANQVQNEIGNMLGLKDGVLKVKGEHETDVDIKEEHFEPEEVPADELSGEKHNANLIKELLKLRKEKEKGNE